MSKKIVDEVLKYTVEVNGNESQKELFDLEKRQRKLTEANKELRAEKRKMQRQNKQGTAEWKALSAQLKQNNNDLEATKSRMTELRKEIGLTALTPRQLKQEASRLRLALNNMIPGSADAKRYQADLKKVNARLTELRMKGQQASFSLKGLADKMNRYQTMGLAVVAATTGVVVSMQKFIDFNGKLADAQSNVEKTTNLTTEQVDQLTKSFGLLKTRTARIELLAIAEEAGRLGKKSIPEILAFTKTANMIKVALGDDLQGDINENVRVIGKLAEQYQIGADIGADFGESMTMIGSAINEVSASGSNQAGFLVDILKRTVGMATQADIAADKIIGLAAAADESGQSQEITATALNKTFLDMAQNVETYASIAGRSTQEFAQLINEDAYEALLVLLEGLKGNSGGLVELAQRFDELGVDGTRTVQVLGALSNNIELIRTRQQQANKALNEATSLYDEFTKKNTNFAAIIDRIRKRIRGFFLDESLTKGLEDSARFVAMFIGAIEDKEGTVTRLRENLWATIKVIGVITVATVSYRAATWLSVHANRALITSIHAKRIGMLQYLAQTRIAVGLTHLYSAAKLALSGNIKRAAVSLRAFNVATKLSVFGALAAVAAAATAAYLAFRKEQDALNAEQRVSADLKKSVAEATAEEKAKLETFLITARNEKLSKEQRLEAMQKLRKLAPDYLGDIQLEEINTLKAKKRTEQYVQALDRKAWAQASFNKRVELQKKLINAESASLTNYVDWLDKSKATLLSLGSAQVYSAQLLTISAKNRQEDIDKTREQIRALDELRQAELQQNGYKDPFTDAANELANQVDGSAQSLITEFYRSDYKTWKEFAQKKLEGTDDHQAALAAKQKEFNEKRQEAEKEIQDFLDGLNQSEVDKIRAKYKDRLALAEKYKLDRVELEKALEKELQTLAAQQLEESVLSEQERQVQLMESSMQQIWDTKYLALLQQAEAEKWTKEQLNKELLALETAHINDVLEQRKKLQLDTTDLETKLLERKKDLSQQEKVAQEEKEVFSRAQSAFTAASQAQSAEEAKDAVLNALRQEIAAQIAAGIANAVKGALATVPFPFNLIAAAGAGAAAGALFSKIVPSFNSGQYDVIDQHGHAYKAKRDEEMLTGLYNKPTVSFGRNKLVAERGQELIVDPAVTKRLLHVRPEVIDIIRHERRVVHGYAEGDYSAISQGTATPAMQETNELLRAMLLQLNKPSVALIPGQTRRYANTLNDLESQIREESKLNS